MRRSRAVWIVIALCVVYIGVVLQSGNRRGGHRAVTRAARAAYEASRPNPSWKPGSHEFLTFGLTAGMTEEEVNMVLPIPTKRVAHLKLVKPQREGFITIYEYKRGPTFKAPPWEPGRKESTESLWVYFDRQGRAVKLDVMHFGAASRERDSAKIQLKPPSDGEFGERFPFIPTPEEAFVELRDSNTVEYRWLVPDTEQWEAFIIDSEEGRSHLADWLLEHKKEMEACFLSRGQVFILPRDLLRWERDDSTTRDVPLLYEYPKIPENEPTWPKRDREIFDNLTTDSMDRLRELFKKYGRPSDR